LTQALEAQQMLGIPLPRVPHLQIAIFFSVFLWCFLEILMSFPGASEDVSSC
jgi:hypothetical protein